MAETKFSLSGKRDVLVAKRGDKLLGVISTDGTFSPTQGIVLSAEEMALIIEKCNEVGIAMEKIVG